MLHSLLKRATSWLQALLTKAFEFGMCKHSVRFAIVSFNLTLFNLLLKTQECMSLQLTFSIWRTYMKGT